jgi:hypothetical protein
MRGKQIGNAHAAIVVVLALALLATLGVVFYQNFIAKPMDNSKTDNKTQTTDTKPKLKTERIAFDSVIYAVDVPEAWTAIKDEQAMGPSTITIHNSDKTIHVKFSVAGSGVGGVCDSNSPLKVRFYQVSSTPVTKLGDFSAYIVEAMTDAEGGGYNYKIGLTQDGGETHAAVGDVYCTVSNVGVASRLVMNAEMVTQPTIFATIDFPKLAAGTDMRVREMQQVKDMMALPDYKEAVKILESARKE